MNGNKETKFFNSSFGKKPQKNYFSVVAQHPNIENHVSSQ